MCAQNEYKLNWKIWDSSYFFALFNFDNIYSILFYQCLFFFVIQTKVEFVKIIVINEEEINRKVTDNNDKKEI